MGIKAAVRFTVKANGTDSALFSVRERTDGDLIIVLRHPEQMQFGDVHDDLLEHRFSVHVSPESEGHTITQRITFRTGDKADTYSHFKPVDNYFIWPVFGNMCVRPEGDRYGVIKRQKDTLISLGSYIVETNTFCYIVLVTSRELNIRHSLSALPVNVHSVKFNRFSLWVISGYNLRPSNHLGSTFVVATMSPRLNGENSFELPFTNNARSLSHRNLIASLLDLMDAMASDFDQRLKNWSLAGGWDVTAIPGWSGLPTWSKLPLHELVKSRR